MIGKLFGNRYEIIAKLGAGGMANVYKARCTILNRIVTVKILRSELAEDKDFVRRFQNEAQAVALLSHPNIVSIYDVGEENGLPYLVMEYVEGKNLKELIRSEGALSPSEVVNIGIQVCAALGHAHSKGIIHRDVKPHNILVAPEGQIKVTDFGLARFLSVPSATMTQSGTVMGSVHYFSPEQARGEEADAQSDIYSLGTVLYEAVSGHVPFQGDSPVSIALKHLQEEPPGLHIENQSIPKELEQIIMKAMAKKPELRFLSAEEMQGALDNIDGFSAPEEELTRAISIPVIPEKKTVKKRKLHPAAIAAIVVGILLLFAGMGYAFFAWYFGGTVAVPDVIGQTESEAAEKLKSEGFEVEANEVFDQGKEVDVVVQQDPVAGMEVKKGRLVRIWVNKGPSSVWLPDFTGAAEREARLALEGRDFIVKLTRENHDSIPEGCVIRQSPEGDQNQPKGTEVTLVVSKGPVIRDVYVPALLGLNVEQAKDALAAVGLNLGEIKEEESSEKKGVIIKQDVEPGSTVKKGGKINVVISSGEPPKDEEPQEVELEINVPAAGEVRVVVKDAQGTREVYKKAHEAGDEVEQYFQVYPPGEFQIYYQGKLNKTIPF
jgi:beta-lactam-binding protein with PASTA domain/tRNA A-37 threonylcarbamoyl transferase component Bud32